MNEQLYIIPHFKDDKLVKTHLARTYPFSFGSLNPDIEMLCLRNIPIWLHNCECPTKCNGDCEGRPADVEWAEYWDKFFNEVTCKTCLHIAKNGFCKVGGNRHDRH